MQREAPDTTPAYAAALLTGFLVLVGLGLLGLPMRLLILGGFGAMLLGTVAYGTWDVLAHRQASSRPRHSGPHGRRPAPRSRRPGVAPAGAHRRRPERRSSEEAGSV
jgi:hypothetical protein